MSDDKRFDITITCVDGSKQFLEGCQEVEMNAIRSAYVNNNSTELVCFFDPKGAEHLVNRNNILDMVILESPKEKPF